MLEPKAELQWTEPWKNKEIKVSVRKIQELTIFRSATINSVSGNVRTKSKIRDICRTEISVQNLNRFSRRIRKININ